MHAARSELIHDKIVFRRKFHIYRAFFNPEDAREEFTIFYCIKLSNSKVEVWSSSESYIEIQAVSENFFPDQLQASQMLTTFDLETRI